MNILEQYRAGDLSYNDAITLLVRQRSEQLHIATSLRGSNPLETAKLRTFAYKQADDLHQQLKKVWYEQGRLTQPAFEQTLNLHRLVSIIKNTATYRTPTENDQAGVLHIPMTADEKFAEHNTGYLALDLKMAQLERLGARIEERARNYRSASKNS